MKRVAQIVRVTDAAARPRAGVTLAVRKAQGPVPEMAWVTGQDGCVRIGLPPGPAELEAFDAAGHRTVFAIEASDRSGQVHDVTLAGDEA